MPRVKVIEFDETTRIPLRIAGWLCAMCIGGAGWVTTLTFQVSAIAKTSDDNSTQIQTIQVERMINREEYLKTIGVVDANVRIIGNAMHLKLLPPPASKE